MVAWFTEKGKNEKEGNMICIGLLRKGRKGNEKKNIKRIEQGGRGAS